MFVLILILILILIVIALAVSIGAVIVMRQRPATSFEATPPELPSKPPVAEPTPMNDLESALAHVTDSTGRPIRERIDAEAGHIDELRVPDDTGPMLRRALDHVANPGADAADEQDVVINADNAAGDDGSSTPES